MLFNLLLTQNRKVNKRHRRSFQNRFRIHFQTGFPDLIVLH